MWPYILIGVLIVLAVGLFFLYKKGKELQEKQESTQQQMQAGAQTQSLLIIDKKRMKLKEANLPKVLLDQTPWYARRSKLPIVKVKIGPKIVSMI